MNPTYLYIKQHSLTGLKYFGKTSKPDPYKYKGSGSHWVRHINKHGRHHVITLWVSELFTDEDTLVELATFMSEELDIVNSDKWANLIIENGLHSGNTGYHLSEEHKLKVSKSLLGKKKSDTHKQNMRKPKSAEHAKKVGESQKGRKQSPEHIAKLSKARKGRIPWNKGISTPEDVKKKISNSTKGRKAWNKRDDKGL